MPARDDQCMPGRDWKPISDDPAVLAGIEDALGGKGAKRASGHVMIQP